MHEPAFDPTSTHEDVALGACLECGSTALEKVLETETFTYGGREKPIEVTALIPCLRCRACGFRFYDEAAQEARHDAACRHLKVMTPAEIRALRQHYGLKQDELAALTGLGVATLGRWERGALIQNEANDRYLYLLTFPENLERLKQRSRSGGQSPASAGVPTPAPLQPPARSRFRTDVTSRQEAGARFVFVPSSLSRPVSTSVN